MLKSPIDKDIQETMKFQSQYISIVIHNAMAEFDRKNLTEAQITELNRLIRNAVYSALYSMQYYKDSVRASEFLDSHVKMIPWYWREPDLLEGIG